GRDAKVVENVRAASRGRPGLRELFHGAPGSFDEAEPAAGAGGGDEVRAAEPRRLDHLYATVDRLLVPLDHPTPPDATAPVRLGFPDREAGGVAEWALPVDLPFQAHLLETEDEVVVAPTAPFVCRFRLPPGDTDLLIVKTAAEVDLVPSRNTGLLVSNAGTL